MKHIMEIEKIKKELMVKHILELEQTKKEADELMMKMKGETKMKKTNQTSGTHLQGTVHTSYDDLVKIFGEPHIKGEPGSKIDVEWAFKFKDGTISTIYNWKDGPCYQGDDGDPVETIKDWHVGGTHKDAVTKVAEKLNRYPEYI